MAKRRQPWERIWDEAITQEKKPELENLTIHGQPCASYNEWYVSKALDKLALIYHYQEPFGLRVARGSQIIDFLVMQAPKPTPLFVHGEYWHRGRMGIDEDLKVTEIDRRMRGYWNPSKIIWEHDCEDIDQAYNTLKEYFS
ncbi:MAG TPA: hypothetical protein PL124_11385 [Candidatus Cloacimonadota bacterium]|nr:hypothetical protein [Candidatus Cloacimonadota bacterium]